jgi:hypothetical protein
MHTELYMHVYNALFIRLLEEIRIHGGNRRVRGHVCVVKRRVVHELLRTNNLAHVLFTHTFDRWLCMCMCAHACCAYMEKCLICMSVCVCVYMHVACVLAHVLLVYTLDYWLCMYTYASGCAYIQRCLV